MVSIKIKWNKFSYDDVIIEPEKGVSAMKLKIQELTGVPTDRQKLMAKGAWVGTLKDDADLSKCSLKDGQQVMLMGTADVVIPPKEAIKFVEDMTSEEKAEKGVCVPAGLNNLGNTCYMNSTLQCFRNMPEVRDVLKPVRRSTVGTTFSSILQQTCQALDSSSESIPPSEFVMYMRTNFPQFAQRSQAGHYAQQDAEEFFTVLSQSLTEAFSSVNADYDSLLGIQVEEQQTCQECPEEPSVTKKERLTKLVCNIMNSITAGPDAKPVDHMLDGIKLGLDGTLEKRSQILGRDAVWTKKQKLASLPKYLCVQFMRFFWKATPESRDHAGVKCKILRPVTFPDTFDVYELCNERLQGLLKVNREKEDKMMEDMLAAKRAKTDGASASASASGSQKAPETVFEKPAATAATAATGGEAAMEVDADDEEAAALKAALAMSLGAEPPTASSSTASASASASASTNGNGSPFGAGVPADFTGKYELHSIVTHKGRDADSGHYIGWARQGPSSNYWWKYDDDTVTEVKTEDILLLKGGGDRDMAYLMFFKVKENSSATSN